MRSYLLLLKLNLTNLLAGLRGGSFRKDNGKIDFSRIIVLLSAALGIVVLVGMVIFLETKLYSVMAGIRMQRLLLGLAFLLCMVTTLLFSLFHTLAAMYFGRDSANLAHLPVSSRAVMAAKWTEIYLPEVALNAGMLLPLMVMYGLDAGGGILYWLRVVVLLLTLPLYPLAISLLLSSLLGRMTSLTRHKEIWVVIGTIVMLVVVIGGEWMLLPAIPEDADAMFFLRLIMDNETLLQTVVGAFPPVLWAVHAMEGNWAEWALFAALGAAIIVGLLYLLGTSYMAVCLRHTEQGVRRKRTTGKIKRDYAPRSPLAALFFRELNEAIKTPVYLLNGVLGVLMMPIVMGGATVGALSSDEAGMLLEKMNELLALIPPTDFMLILAALFSLICWITPIISTAVSREGQRLPITRMIPVPARTILNAKILVNFAINAVGAAIVAVMLVVLLGVGYVPHVLGSLVLVLLLTYATSVVNLAVDTSRPMLNWKNENQVMKTNMNQTIGMLLSTLMMAALIAPPFFLLSQGPVARLLVVLGVLAVECGVAFLLMRKFVEPRYAALEP